MRGGTAFSATDFQDPPIFFLIAIPLWAGPACQQETESAPVAALATEEDLERAKRPRHVALTILEGEGVTLSGAVSGPDSTEGVIRLDVVTLAPGKPPELVHQTTLAGLGDFEIALPVAFGEIHLVAYIDLDNNGPSKGELVATHALLVGDTALEGIRLELSSTTDLGPLAPGAPPPPDAGPPPEDKSGMMEESSQAAADR